LSPVDEIQNTPERTYQNAVTDAACSDQVARMILIIEDRRQK